MGRKQWRFYVESQDMKIYFSRETEFIEYLKRNTTGRESVSCGAMEKTDKEFAAMGGEKGKDDAE
jgi:hypothetical protein